MYRDGLSRLLSFAACCLKSVSHETVGIAGAGAWVTAAVLSSGLGTCSPEFVSWGCTLRLDHVWAWRLASDGNQRPLPQRQAESPNFLLALRRPLLGWGLGARQKSVSLLKTQDLQGTGETVSTASRSPGEAVSLKTGAGGGSVREGGWQREPPSPRGCPSGLWAPVELKSVSLGTSTASRLVGALLGTRGASGGSMAPSVW